jgi:hypothetical protein
MKTMFSVAAIVATFAAILLLWTAWRRHGAARMPFLASIAAGVAATSLWILAFGAEVGIPLTLEGAAIVAFLFILSRIEVRQGRTVRDRHAAAPVRTPGRAWRGITRGLAAGPIGLGAAIGIGVLFATTAPLDDSTRLILAGLLVPSLWAIAMIWTLASRRPLAPAAGLLGIAVATIGLSLAAGR